MNTLLTSSLRAATLATTLFVLPTSLTAKDSVSASRTAELLAAHGSIAVRGAGPYVERGTFQIQVAAKLGEPTEKLADGTWLYKNFSTDENAVKGTLIVRFNHERRVSELSLATPAVVAALRTAPTPGEANLLMTAQSRR